MATDPEDVLKDYLQGARDTLIWKLDGLSERGQRLPRTPTGGTDSQADWYASALEPAVGTQGTPTSVARSVRGRTPAA